MWFTGPLTSSAAPGPPSGTLPSHALSLRVPQTHHVLCWAPCQLSFLSPAGPSPLPGNSLLPLLRGCFYSRLPSPTPPQNRTPARLLSRVRCPHHGPATWATGVSRPVPSRCSQICRHRVAFALQIESHFFAGACLHAAVGELPMYMFPSAFWVPGTALGAPCLVSSYHTPCPGKLTSLCS